MWVYITLSFKKRWSNWRRRTKQIWRESCWRRTKWTWRVRWVNIRDELLGEVNSFFLIFLFYGRRKENWIDRNGKVVYIDRKRKRKCEFGEWWGFFVQKDSTSFCSREWPIRCFEMRLAFAVLALFFRFFRYLDYNDWFEPRPVRLLFPSKELPLRLLLPLCCIWKVSLFTANGHFFSSFPLLLLLLPI